MITACKMEKDENCTRSISFELSNF